MPPLVVNKPTQVHPVWYLVHYTHMASDQWVRGVWVRTQGSDIIELEKHRFLFTEANGTEAIWQMKILGFKRKFNKHFLQMYCFHHSPDFKQILGNSVPDRVCIPWVPWLPSACLVILHCMKCYLEIIRMQSTNKLKIKEIRAKFNHRKSCHF